MKRLTYMLLVLALSVGCEEEQEKNPYKPGGQFYQQLDASGKRHIITNADGKRLGKVRLRDESVRVYGADMTASGTLRWNDGIVWTPRGGEEVRFVRSNDQSVSFGEILRLERVERGWAVLRPDAQRLGYVEHLGDGRFAARADYSSAPRAYAHPEPGEVRSPAGAVLARATPPLPAVVMLPMVFDGKLALGPSLALGKWISENVVPDSPGEPVDAGSYADGDAGQGHPDTGGPVAE